MTFDINQFLQSLSRLQSKNNYMSSASFQLYKDIILMILKDTSIWNIVKKMNEKYGFQ
mgnify:CR=1 FL=1